MRGDGGESKDLINDKLLSVIQSFFVKGSVFISLKCVEVKARTAPSLLIT